MAVLVELDLAGATAEHVAQVERLVMERGQRIGGPPYRGCIFVAVTPGQDGMRFTSAWRTEPEFRETFATALKPDLNAAGMTPGEPTVSPIVSMAVPGAHMR